MTKDCCNSRMGPEASVQRSVLTLFKSGSHRPIARESWPSALGRLVTLVLGALRAVIQLPIECRPPGRPLKT